LVQIFGTHIHNEQQKNDEFGKTVAFLMLVQSKAITEIGYLPSRQAPLPTAWIFGAMIAAFITTLSLGASGAGGSIHLA
jgi:hypothetical protein